MPETVRSFDGSRIAYVVKGSGPAVLLLHGFGADHVLNWARPDVIDALTGAAARHRDGRPGPWRLRQPHNPDTYGGDAMVRDAQAVLDHLGVEHVDVVGYSMGSMVAARLVPEEPRTRALVLGGVGATVTPPRSGGRRPRQSRPRSWPTIRRRSRTSPGRPSASSPISPAPTVRRSPLSAGPTRSGTRCASMPSRSPPWS